MKIKLKFRKIKSSELIFFSGLFLWILQSYMIQTDFLRFYGYSLCTVVRLASLSLLVFKIIFIDYKYSKITFCLCIICLLIAMSTQFTTSQTTIDTFINVFIIIMAARNIPFEKITYFIFVVSSIGFLITISFAFLGVINNSVIITNGEKRYYLGFDYVSFASIYLVNIIFCGVYSYTAKKKNSLPWTYIILALGMDYFIYKMTATRLTFGIILIFVLLYIIVEKFHIPLFNNKRMMGIISIGLFPIMGLGTYWLSSSYIATDEKWMIFNKILSNRLLLNKRAITMYNIKWFGQVIEFNTDFNAGIDSYMYIDSGYMNLLLQYGIIAFITVLIIYSFMLWMSIKETNNVLIIWLICVCIYNMINGMLLSPVTTNSSLFAIWGLATEARKYEKRKIKNGYTYRGSNRYI